MKTTSSTLLSYTGDRCTYLGGRIIEAHNSSTIAKSSFRQNDAYSTVNRSLDLHGKHINSVLEDGLSYYQLA